MISRSVLVSAAALLALAVATPGTAQERAAEPASASAGFYGGVALRNAGVDAAGISLGHLATTWGRYASPVSDDASNRALVFGGYRWTNDVALEGSFATADRYALQPSDAAARRGIGLSLSSTPALSSRRGMPTSIRVGRSARASRSTGAWAMRKARQSRPMRLPRCRRASRAACAMASTTALACVTTSRLPSDCGSNTLASAVSQGRP